MIWLVTPLSLLDENTNELKKKNEKKWKNLTYLRVKISDQLQGKKMI